MRKENYKDKKLFKNFESKYNNMYVFILESNSSLKCVGWGSYLNFYQKYWNYIVVDYKNFYCDQTTSVILTKNKSITIM